MEHKNLSKSAKESKEIDIAQENFLSLRDNSNKLEELMKELNLLVETIL
jgi:hypothetical protein